MDFAISAEEYQWFRTLTHDESGIVLGDQKQTLVDSRLSKRPAKVTAGVYDAQ
jgi:chemotaxis protein methyltransferase CheR